MGEWTDITLDKKLFLNVDESALTSTFGALENCFVTESSGLSRFPGLREFVDLGGNGEVHMGRADNDMIAVGTDGLTHRIDSRGNHQQIEGAPVLGGGRTSFARTRDGLMMAAGAQIIKYDGSKNSVLSPDAPLSSNIGFIDGYVLAVEKDSGRFQHCVLNNPKVWRGIDTFGVDGAPDNINSMLITPFNEVLFGGESSIEQYERYVGGNVPFFRRWSVADGISEPGTLCFADNTAWALNDRHEFVKLSGQTSQSVSDDIQKEIEDQFSTSKLDNLKNSWAAPANVKGQKFIIFQSPQATNIYGTKGFTGVLDIRRGNWFQIEGWDDANGVPTLWPGVSVFSLWGRTFVGGRGKIYELDSNQYNNDGKVQRVYARTAHFDTLGTMRVDGVRITLKRGVGGYDTNPKLMFRSNPDNKGFGNMQIRELGNIGANGFVIEFGAQGTADTWQFEFGLTDECQFDMRRLQLNVTKIAR